MLTSLYIKDFGLIKQAEVTFSHGLNVLSGETGAGKSIILEALKAALGGRAQTEMIKTGCTKALVQVTLDYTNLKQVQLKLKQYGLEEENASCLLVMSRELNQQGRHICRVNGRIVNLSVYREIAADGVDLHGQHDMQSLLLPEKQMLLLDSYGDAALPTLRKQVARAYEKWQSHWQRLQQSVNGGKSRLHRLDLLNYQKQEIDAAALENEDEQKLREQQTSLAHAEQIRLLMEQILQWLYTGTHHQQAAVDLLGQSHTQLEELCRYLPQAKNWLEHIYSALCLVEDTGREVASLRENIEVNPQLLNDIEQRLSLIETLKRKYGHDIPAILAYRRQIEQELDDLGKEAQDEAGLEELVAQCETDYHVLADKLTAKRTAMAEHISAAVVVELQELVMDNVKFAVTVDDSMPSFSGKNKIEFLISPNIGEPLKPLAKIASGGELSRVLLAIKSTLVEAEDIGTLVFDEVDAGTGGRTLQAVAEKLAQMAKQKQVICVTHAAAIAAYADTHYLIEKHTHKEQTITTVHQLVGEQRIQEISRMLGGDINSSSLAQYARKIIKN